MIAINDQLPGGHVFRNDTQLNGMVAGSATVAAGVRLLLNGRIAGDLTVQAGAHAEINGTITGSLINEGGTVEVSGVIKGTLWDGGARKTVVNFGAVVDGTRFE